jgi:hypothetical protein
MSTACGLGRQFLAQSQHLRLAAIKATSNINLALNYELLKCPSGTKLPFVALSGQAYQVCSMFGQADQGCQPLPLPLLVLL